MQVKILLSILSIFFIKNTFAYDCKIKELPLAKVTNKKPVFKMLQKLDRQVVVEGLLFELTSINDNKKKAKKAEVILNYLENSEANKNQRSFFKLLSAASELNTQGPKTLKLLEICEIMDKVNALDK